MNMSEFKVNKNSFLHLIACFVYVNGCYFNAECPYGLFGAKTPYDTIRGDIRDHLKLDNCEAVSVWTIIRHGNRKPDTKLTKDIKEIDALKDKIINSYDAGTSQLCAQDIDHLRTWDWNSTLDVNLSALTTTGYKELYGIGKRIKDKYPYLLQGTADQFYFRSTNEQRTIDSGTEFISGLTEDIDLNVTVDDPQERDHIIGPYANCDRYQKDVLAGPVLAHHMDTYFTSPEFVTVQQAVQARLGIITQLSAADVMRVYNSCRRYRAWTENLKSPWCAVFTNKDLMVLEYYDDLKHYYRNGHGSWVNVNLGKIPLKDLYENFEAAVNGEGKKLVGYFTHDTMMHMIFSALGLYMEDVHLESTVRNPNRVWRTSYIGAYSANMMAVLNRCNEAGHQTHRVQFFNNEKKTSICPPEGCFWEQFQEKFQMYTTANLSFCSMDYVYTPPDELLAKKTP